MTWYIICTNFYLLILTPTEKGIALHMKKMIVLQQKDFVQRFVETDNMVLHRIFKCWSRIFILFSYYLISRRSLFYNPRMLFAFWTDAWFEQKDHLAFSQGCFVPKFVWNCPVVHEKTMSVVMYWTYNSVILNKYK